MEAGAIKTLSPDDKAKSPLKGDSMSDHNSPDSPEEGEEDWATLSKVVYTHRDFITALEEPEPEPPEEEDYLMARQAMEGAADLQSNNHDDGKARSQAHPTRSKLKAVLNYAIIAVILAAALVATYIVSASSTTVAQAEEQQKANQPGEESGGKENNSAPPPAPASPAEAAPVASAQTVGDNPPAAAASTATVASDQGKPEDTSVHSQGAPASVTSGESQCDEHNLHRTVLRVPENQIARLGDLGDRTPERAVMLHTSLRNLVPPEFPLKGLSIIYQWIAPSLDKKIAVIIWDLTHVPGQHELFVPSQILIDYDPNDELLVEEGKLERDDVMLAVIIRGTSSVPEPDFMNRQVHLLRARLPQQER